MASKVDFKYKDGSKIFFTSDTHFGHEGILRFCHRPFATTEENDTAIIENWNKVVPYDGLVFHLGDFAWGGAPFWRSIRSRLNGSIILIKGNHDVKNLTQTAANELFDSVVWQMSIEVEGRKAILNHYPFLCYAGTYRDKSALVYQLFGHVHSGPLSKDGRDEPRLVNLFKTQYDVGVDNNNFTPISWYEVDEKIQRQINEKE